MATFTNAFDSYEVFYYSPPTAPAPFAAVAQLYQGGVFVGQIAFTHDSLPLPPNKTISPLGTVVPAINYFLSQFESVVGIMRKQKSLYIFYDDMNKVGMIATSAAQPTGV